MPSSKRQRTIRGSSASSHVDSERSGSESPRPHKSIRRESNGDKENKDPTMTRKPIIALGESARRIRQQHRSKDSSPGKPKNKTRYEYICFHRPRFDVDGENWRKWSEGKAERLEEHELSTQLYQPILDDEDKQGIWASSPSHHKDHKWVIMWSAWQRFDGFCRRAKYRDTNGFDIHLDTDWQGWGMQEIVDSAMVDFDKAFSKKDASRIDEMWAIMSAIGLWLNVEDVSSLINNEDSKKTCELVSVIGCALLTVLSAIDRIGQLKPDSRFLDLALVIGYFLELSHDLPAYGVEVSCMGWRRETGLLFKKGKLDPQRGLFDTDCRLKELETALETEPVNSDDETEDENDSVLPQLLQRNERDPWDWNTTMRKYKKTYGDTIGLQRDECTKTSSTKRGEALSEKKNPLGEIGARDHRRNKLA